MTTPPAVVDPWISPRPKLAALWTATMFVFAYADLSSLYRADVRADLDAGELAGFTVDGGFLLAVTLYVTIPSLMVALSLLLPKRALRPVGMALAVLYVLTIAVSAVGEWGLLRGGEHRGGGIADRRRLRVPHLAAG
jgi:hypothetical protein